MDFATIFSKISTGAQIAQAAAPEIQQYGADHVTAPSRFSKSPARAWRPKPPTRPRKLRRWPQRSWPPAWFRWRLSSSPASSISSPCRRLRDGNTAGQPPLPGSVLTCRRIKLRYSSYIPEDL